MASLIRRKYKAKDKNGKIVTKQSPYWYIDYKGIDGVRKRIKGFKDKAATAQLAAKLEREAELARAGIVDKYKIHRKTPLVKHLEDFKASLINKGTTLKQARLVYNRAKAVIDSGKFVYMSDVSASKTQRYLAERRRDGLSIRSSNFYLQATKQFCRWLVADNRTDENPLAYLQGQNPNTDIRHPRRALTTDELNRLLETTAKGSKHHRMTGKERLMLYTLAVSTGFRANELASLTWQSFNLSDSKPSVTVLAAYSKHRRDDVQPLRLDVANRLAAWKAELEAEEQAKVFATFNPNKGADILKKDLEAAGIEYEDAAGRFADFHSLRHSFASILNQSGVSPKVAQSLLRHSTISLTMDTYTHIGLYDERAALDSMPKLPGLDKDGANENKSVALKMGTDDLPVTSDKSVYKPVYKKLAKNAYFDSNQISTNGTGEHQALETKDICKSLDSEMLGNENNQVSPLGNEKNNRRRWDSNPRITVLQTVALGLLATPPKQA